MTYSRLEKERKSKGLCVVCGAKAEPGKVRCAACSEKNNKRSQKLRETRKNQGLCTVCGTAVCAGTTLCEDCKIKYSNWKRELKEKRKSQGLCVYCGAAVVPNKILCKKCYLKKTSLTAFKTNKNWKKLEELLEIQNHKCALTGDPILFGADINLDHIIPISAGGKRELSNVRWVTHDANMTKHSLTDKELEKICEKILKKLKHKDKK